VLACVIPGVTRGGLVSVAVWDLEDICHIKEARCSERGVEVSSYDCFAVGAKRLIIELNFHLIEIHCVKSLIIFTLCRLPQFVGKPLSDH
jgi:hypothetical protein